MSNLGLKNDQAQDATTTREAPSRQELAQFAAAAVLTSVCVAAVARFLFIVLVLCGFFYIWKKGVLDWSADQKTEQTQEK